MSFCFEYRDWIYPDGHHPHSISIQIREDLYKGVFREIASRVDKTKKAYFGDLNISDGRECFTLNFNIATVGERDEAIEVLKRLRTQINKLSLVFASISDDDLFQKRNSDV